ncbi:EamA family transporter [Tsukamurella sp. 8F]|uniref:EamA family transporter n=1 Tax=unclassified Tsukamurella TaxID=2633480 RepID=UPI0023BA2E8A|nr:MULTISPECIES: EamA family transporter [unclassified Tsukamurella]MDF0532429.1 EamA family transporter [Tsukamurella sp. 8J]MDF0585195.1 EamA family transporter [Tsukamurella sp. 8F]
MNRLTIPLVFVVGAVSQYVGASLGIGLFDRLSPEAVAWLRGAGAGIVLVVALRPWRGQWPAARLRHAALFGCITIAMNMAFYASLAHIDMGTAVAIEFLGPIAVASLGSRRLADGLSVVCALAGVACVAGVRWGGGLAGVGFALLAAACWAGYIVVGKRVADAGSGIDVLGVGLALGAAVLAVPAMSYDVVVHTSAFARPEVWLMGLGVGLLSSVIPYALDQVVLPQVGRARFALLLALLPVTATVVGAVTLGQMPTAAELAGIALVVVAITVSGRDTGSGRDDHTPSGGQNAGAPPGDDDASASARDGLPGTGG